MENKGTKREKKGKKQKKAEKSGYFNKSSAVSNWRQRIYIARI